MVRWIVTKLSQINTSISGITIDSDSNLYFTANSAIWKYNTINATSQPTVLIGNREINSMLTGIVWNNNKLFVCDWTQHKIYEYCLDTNVFRSLNESPSKKGGYKDGTLKEALFRSPWGITTDNNGDLYITDKHHVRKINLQAQTVETIAGSTHKDEMAFDNGHATKQAKFNFPAGIAVDNNDGTIYVCDFSNHCIRRVKDGIVSTVAGSPKKYGFRSGPLPEALFVNPIWLILNDDGSFIVSGGRTIRKLDINAEFVSELGIGVQIPFGDSCLTRDKEGNLYLGTKQGLILKLEEAWKTERLLWIGHLKSDPKNCYWVNLPKEIIKEIWKIRMQDQVQV